ncbi:MAG: glycosyltransferase [Lachnospiraceae bacterium]|nr:glycosyltransferase [Lachnospiraceae bacterium]
MTTGDQMTVAVLMSVLNKDPMTAAKDARLATEAVMVIQGDREGTAEFAVPDCEGNERGVSVVYDSGRGVGRSRNTAIDCAPADADILMFCDDDIRYDEGYGKAVAEEFRRIPQADLITFNMRVDATRHTYENQGRRRIHFWNSGRYPAYSIAVRSDAVRQSGVRFSTLFGGGARYGSGEDSLFLTDCLKAGMKLYTSPVFLGRELERPEGSTWFKGYNEKYFIDKGVLYSYLYGRSAGIISRIYLMRHREQWCVEVPYGRALALLKKGVAEGLQLQAESSGKEEDK